MKEPRQAIHLAGGRYVTHAVLARGIYATVYEAVDHQFAVNRAVKVLHPDVVAQRPDLWQRMKLEARVMNRLAHPNVMRVYDLVEQGNRICVVMDLADGGTLADWLVLLGPLPPAHALGYLVQVLSALATAHVNGIVHRDVKPQNILVDRRGVALLSDFGAALHAGPGDDAMAVIGTTGFMAPEQLHRNQGVGAAADLYAVAATLFALLTTRNPAGLSDEDADSPRWAGLGDDLVALIRKGMATDPADRFADAPEMAQAVEAARLVAPTVPLAPFEPDHEDFFPLAAGSAAEASGWGEIQAHLPPYPAAIQIALSFLDDPPLFREVEVGASLLAEPTHETGGTLVAPDESWMSPEEAVARNLDDDDTATEVAPDGAATEDVVGPDAAEQPLGLLPDEGSQTPLGFLPDDSDISGLLPPEASGVPDEILAEAWAARLQERKESDFLRKRSRTRFAEDRAADGVRQMRPMRLTEADAHDTPERWKSSNRPAPVQEPRQPISMPRLPVGTWLAVAMVLVVLFVGFKLGGGFERSESSSPAGVATQQPPPVEELIPAPRPREVRVQAAPTQTPSVRSKGASAPGAGTRTAGTPAVDSGQTPLGRWVGTLNGRQVTVVLRGQPSAFTGTVTTTFQTNDVPMAVAGSYDSGTRMLSFRDLDTEPRDAGKYTGSVSSDGRRFEGSFETFSGGRLVALIMTLQG